MPEQPVARSLEEIAAQLTMAWVHGSSMGMSGESPQSGPQPSCGSGGEMRMGPSPEAIGAAFARIYQAIVTAKRTAEQNASA